MSDTAQIIWFDGDSYVHASAGSGKTTLLVEKFFKLLMRENEGRFARIDRILAITFTEKAADEMRLRISRKIRDEIAKISAEGATKENKAVLAHLMDSRRRASQSYISTIHSFCARVLRENPVEAGLDPMFEIMDAQRSAALMSDALTKFLLTKLRNGSIADLAYAYGFIGDGGFETSLAKIMEKLFPLIRAADMGEKTLLAESREVFNVADEKAARCLESASTLAAELAKAAKNERGVEMLRKISDGLASLQNSQNRERSVRVCEELHKMLDLKAFPKNETARALKNNLGEACEWLAATMAFGTARELAALFSEFRIYYASKIKKRAMLDFDDLQELTLALFNRHGAIRDHYRELFHGVLVDEFQDVNRLQKEIVYSITAPGEGKLFIVGDPKQAIYGFRGGDTSVFEEAKQDILKKSGGKFGITTNYRSIPELVNFVNRFFGEFGDGLFGEEDVCSASRASSGTAAVERLTFEPLKTADANRYMEARLAAQRIKQMTGGANGDDFRFGDVVLLFRKLTALPLYESVFNAAEIPTAVVKGSGFYQSQEVADVASVLSLIDDPTDLISWVATLRSPLVGCSDETVLTLRRGQDGKLRDTSTFPDVKELERLVADAFEREKLFDFIGWYADVKNAKDRLTISETIEHVLEKSGFMGVLSAQLNGVQKAANVAKLIELARSMESAGPASLKNFVRRITALVDANQQEPQATAATPDQNVVTIMTIHQAKGLEFPVVFLMDIDGATGAPPSPVVFDQHRGMAVKYVDRDTLKSHRGMDHLRISGLEEEKRKKDALRLFYVGCTRAKDRLVLSGCKMTRSKDGMADRVDVLMEKYPELFREALEIKPAALTAEVTATAYDVLRNDHSDRQAADIAAPVNNVIHHAGQIGGFFSVGDVTTFNKCPRQYLLGNIYKIPPDMKTRGSGLSAVEIGSGAHAILERIDLTAPEKKFGEFLKNELKERLPNAAPADVSAVEKCVLNVLEMEVIKKLRSGRLKLVGTEIPFAYKFGGGFFMEGKIDLLLRDADGTPWVVDYKFSSKEPEPSAKMQAQLYALAVSRFTGSDSVGCALLYAKGKPRQYEWVLTNDLLEKIAKDARDTVIKIIEFEEKYRGRSGLSLPIVEEGFVCPDNSCHFAGYCNQ